MRIAKFTFAAVIVLASATIAQAQIPFGTKDDRYKGYPTALVAWPKKAITSEELATCAAQKPYEPRDTSLTKYANRLTKHGPVRVQATDECTFMRVAGGDRWVLRVKGTKVQQDEMGRDLVDIGSPTGPVCYNPRAFSIPVNVPPPPPPAPPPAPPAPAPVAPADVCPNIEGVQTTVPKELVVVNGNCVAPPPPPRDVCPNIEGVQTFVPGGLVVGNNGDCVGQSELVDHAKKHQNRSPGLVVTLGLGYVIGTIHSDYSDPVPDTGDVPQRNSFASFVPIVRIDQSVDQGIFGSFSGNFLGSTSGMEFQDITGAWNGKNRDTDDSRDKAMKVKVGYKHSLGDFMTLGGYGGWSRFCLCEDYLAQGATTTTERSYKGFIAGVEAVGSTASPDHRVTVTVNGEFGPSLTRKSWTHQDYPGISFPTVNHADEDARSFGFRAEGDVRVFWMIHASLAYDYLGIRSTRPDTFTAHERVGVNAVTFGVNFKWD